ncbi:hypothetical protein O3P69_014596 [Scylla paramamosain]|uniref:Uncharacterized protein n=1 Tax=Scylla paramamosain TaxID=85552 RepID=A0AAW0TYI3_SCYPA
MRGARPPPGQGRAAAGEGELRRRRLPTNSPQSGGRTRAGAERRPMQESPQIRAAVVRGGLHGAGPPRLVAPRGVRRSAAPLPPALPPRPARAHSRRTSRHACSTPWGTQAQRPTVNPHNRYCPRLSQPCVRDTPVLPNAMLCGRLCSSTEQY